MKYKEFEKHMQYQLTGLEIPVDTDALWQNLQSEKKIYSAKSKWVLLLLLFLIIILGGLIFFSEQLISVDERNNTKIHADLHGNIECLDFLSQNAKTKQNNDVLKKEEIITPQRTTVLSKESGLSRPELNQKYSTGKFESQPTNEEKNGSTDPLVSATYNSEQIPLNHLKEDNHKSSAIDITQPAFLPGLQIVPVSSNADFGGGVRSKRQPTGCPTFDRRAPYTFEIIPEIGYFRPFKTLSNNFQEPSELYDLRKNHEKSLEGIQAALYGRLNLGDLPLYLQSGLYYTRTSERMNLDYNYIRRDTTFGIISITRSPTGDTVTTIYGDIVRENRVSGTSVGHHYLQTLDIPVIIGYEFPMGRFIFGIEGGIFFNLFLKSSGRILDSPSTFTEVDDTDNFRSAIGLNYMASANVSTPLGPGRIYLAGRYRHFPNAFTNDGTLIRQEYRQMGLHLGYIIPLTRTGLKVL